MIYAIYSTASLILACILASFFTKQKPNYLVIGLVAIVYFLGYSMIAHSDEFISRYSCKVLEYTYENTSENYEWFENTVWGHCRRMHVRHDKERASYCFNVSGRLTGIGKDHEVVMMNQRLILPQSPQRTQRERFKKAL